MKKIILQKGFSLVEMVIAVAIMTLIIGAYGAFQSDVFSFNRMIQTSINNQYEASKIIAPFSDEVRGAIPSEQGSYAIATAGTSTFIFFADYNSDGKIEKIRYFLDDKIFKKGVTAPTGNPATYNSSNEKIIQVVHNVIPQNIFSYYDSNYDGTAGASALSFPVTPSDVRLVKIALEVDDDLNKAPTPITVQTQVTIRNLKDNR